MGSRSALVRNTTSISVKKKDVKNSSDVKDAEFKDLGRLRAFRGSQNYPIPEGVNPRDYDSVVIWCETFGVLISPAPA